MTAIDRKACRLEVSDRSELRRSCGVRRTHQPRRSGEGRVREEIGRENISRSPGGLARARSSRREDRRHGLSRQGHPQISQNHAE